MSKQPTTITVTGAASQIGFAPLFRITCGAFLTPDTPIRNGCWRSCHPRRSIAEHVNESWPRDTLINVTDAARRTSAHARSALRHIDHMRSCGARPIGPDRC